MAEYVTRGQRSGKRRNPSLQQAVRAFGDVAAALSDAPDSPDTDHLLHMIGDRMCELVGVSRCSVYLRDGRTGLFRGQVGRARSDIDARVKRLVAGTYADQFTREILATGKTVVLSDAASDPRPIRSTMRRWGVSSMLGVPMVFRGEVIGVVYLDDEDGAAEFSPLQQEIGSAFADLAAVMIAQAQSSTEMREALETSQRQNQHLRRAGAVDDRLARSLVDGLDLDGLVRDAAELTGKPVAVFDGSWRRKALHRPRAAGKHPIPDLEDVRISGHPAFDEAVAGIGPGRSRVIDPLPAVGVPQRLIVVGLPGPDGTVGSVVLVEAGSTFQALDAHVARRTAVNAAVLLTVETRLAKAASTGRDVLVGDLLRDDLDTEEADRTASLLGITPGRPHVVCLIADVGEPRSQIRAEAVARGLDAPDRGADDRVVVGTVPEGVVAIVPTDRRADDDHPAAGVRSRMLGLLHDAGLPDATVVAMSEVCRGGTEFAEGFADARQVLSCMQRFADEDGPRVLAAGDLGAGRLFVANASREDSERFARRALGPLLGGGAPERDLVATLQAFFSLVRSIRRSAALLGVHENTVRHRLAKVEELTGLNVMRDARDQLTAELALLVLQLRGDCPWPTADAVDPAVGHEDGHPALSAG